MNSTNKKQLDLSDTNIAYQSMNKIALIGDFILCIVLTLAYLIEVFKGARTFPSYLIIFFFGLAPVLAAALVYAKNKSSHIIRYITSVGFACLYGYLLFNTESDLVFCYIIVFFVLMVVFTDFKLLVIMGLYALIMNVASIASDAVTNGLSAKEITNAEIVIACLALTIVFTMMAVKKIAAINQANMEKAALEKQQSDELLTTTLDIAKNLTNNIISAVSETDSLKSAIDTTQKDMAVLTSETNEATSIIESQRTSTNKINEYIQGVNTAMVSIVEEVSNAENNLTTGSNIMKELLHQVHISETSSAQVTKEMTTLKDYTEKMQDIMSLIQSVADQTGLLALNASIEAARAGEAGRGFAVVAAEISNLSAQTKTATENISNLIKNVVLSVDDVNVSMEQLLDSNRMQNQYVENTAQNFASIHHCTEEISNQISRLKTTVEVVTEANSQVAENVEHVSNVMQKVSEGADGTLTSCNTNLQSIATVTTIMDNLKNAANKLNSSTVSDDTKED